MSAEMKLRSGTATATEKVNVRDLLREAGVKTF